MKSQCLPLYAICVPAYPVDQCSNTRSQCVIVLNQVSFNVCSILCNGINPCSTVLHTLIMYVFEKYVPYKPKFLMTQIASSDSSIVVRNLLL